MYVKSRQASVKTSNHHEVTSALYEKIRRATLKGDDLTGENVFCKVGLNIYNITEFITSLTMYKTVNHSGGRECTIETYKL